MRYKIKFLVDFNPLLDSKRKFSQQKALNYIRIFIAASGAFIYILLNPTIEPRLFAILSVIVLYCTLLFLSRKLHMSLFRRRLLSNFVDIILIFFLCYFSGGPNSLCFLAFLLPVLVSSVEPSFVRLLLVMFVTLIAMVVLGLVTVFDPLTIFVTAVYIIFAGLLVNVLSYSDFRILANYAIRDGLTGLYTHQFFYDTLGKMLDESEENIVNIVMIDLDDFKQLNDQYGHLHGDRVLRKVADTIKANVRDTDIVARYGGDEFAIILPGVDEALCSSIIDRLRESLINLGHFSHVSLGCARYPEEAEEPYELVDLADKRMYSEKKLNRDISAEKPVFNERRLLH
ncbi:MAG: GGDEF domain-containing protein [Deltaproteobacteria bacterium]